MTGIKQRFSELPAVALMIFVGLCIGPHMVLSSVSQNGHIDWFQLAVGVQGTLLWVLLIAEVATHV
jgi:hypothetical protein